MNRTTINVNKNDISILNILDSINKFKDKWNDGLIVITGPTTSGKTALSLEIAKLFPSEIISADSRQIYRKMDIGTNKIPIDDELIYESQRVIMCENIIHYMINILDPGENYSILKYVNDSKGIILGIKSMNKTPLIVGGTGYYINHLINNTYFPTYTIPIDVSSKVRGMSRDDKINFLEKKDPNILQTIDLNNDRRLQAPIEYILVTNKQYSLIPKADNLPFNYLIIKITAPSIEMYKSADLKLMQRLDNGLIEEVEMLLKCGISSNWLQSIGLEYKFVSKYLTGEISKVDMKEQLKYAIHHYIKRQLTYMNKYL